MLSGRSGQGRCSAVGKTRAESKKENRISRPLTRGEVRLFLEGTLNYIGTDKKGHQELTNLEQEKLREARPERQAGIHSCWGLKAGWVGVKGWSWLSPWVMGSHGRFWSIRRKLTDGQWRKVR